MSEQEAIQKLNALGCRDIIICDDYFITFMNGKKEIYKLSNGKLKRRIDKNIFFMVWEEVE